MSETLQVEDTLTVHNYAVCSSSPSIILDVGRDLIHQATKSSGWYSVNPISNQSKATFDLGRNVFLFAKNLPDVDVNGGFMELKDWGAPLGESDETSYEIKDLEEFESTNLGLFPMALRRDYTQFMEKRLPCTSSVEELPAPPRKRRRIETGSLFNIIPQPHYHPPPVPPPELEPTPPGITPYTKTQPRPLKPFTEESMKKYLGKPYARCAWVVPVRGLLPWEGCSAGLVINSEEKELEVTWTHDSLNAFWAFLVALKNAGTLGSIALSFHPAPTMNIVQRESLDESVGAKGSHEFNSDSGSNAISNSGSGRDAGAEICRAPLSAVDHIKVYHDVGHAMFVRNVLDAWAFKRTGGGEEGKTDTVGGESMSVARKVRVLKGAKLVLVDATSKGVLIS